MVLDGTSKGSFERKNGTRSGGLTSRKAAQSLSNASPAGRVTQGNPILTTAPRDKKIKAASFFEVVRALS